MKALVFGLAMVSASALANPVVKVAPPVSQVVAAAQAPPYNLRNLKPSGFTHYSGSGDVSRHYFEFQNGQGRHVFVYEETANARPPRVITVLRQAASTWDSSCSVDVECAGKAYCGDGCHEMYYELANLGGDSALEKNKCKIQFLSCENNRVPASVESAPAKAVASPIPRSGG